MKYHSRTDVLFMSHLDFISGGAEMSLLAQLKYLADKGVNCHVIVNSEGQFTSILQKNNIPYSCIPFTWWTKDISDKSVFSTHGDTIRLIVELIELIKPVLTVTNTSVVPWLAYASGITNVKHAWVIREDIFSNKSVGFVISDKDIIKTIDCFSDKVFFNSNYMKANYKQSPVITKAGIIYPEVYSHPTNSSVSIFKKNVFKLVLVGRVEPLKDTFCAIKALNILVNNLNIPSQLAIVGTCTDPAYFSEINNYIDKNHLKDSVIFTGFQDNPSSIVTQADVALTCSTLEPFGRTTVEAMVLGKPVVGADNSGTAEIINDGHTGLLYKTHNHKDLAAKIHKLILNSSLIYRLGSGAKTDIEKRFTADECYKDFMQYFKSITNRPYESFDISPLHAAVFSGFIENNELKKTILSLRNEISSQTSLINRSSVELENILSSKSWRIVKIAKRMLRK